MKLKIKTLEVFGIKKPIGHHIVHGGVDSIFFKPEGKIYLYEEGVVRKVKTLNIPLFKITIEYQVASIEVASGMDGSINYNKWKFI